MSTAQAGLFGALAGLGQNAQQIGASAREDILAQRRAELAERLKIAAEGRAEKRQIDAEARAKTREEEVWARNLTADVAAENRAMAAYRKQQEVKAEFEQVEDVDHPLFGPGQRNKATKEFTSKAPKGGEGSGSGSGGSGAYGKLTDYQKAISDQFRYDWDNAKDEGTIPDPETRKYLVATGQEIGTALHQLGRALPPATVTADTLRALNSGQFPNLSYNNAVAAAQKALYDGKSKTEGGWFSEGGEPILPDPNDPKVKAKAYQLQEESRDQLRAFMFNQYFKPDEYQQGIQKQATPEPTPKKQVDVAGLLSKIPKGTNVTTLGEDVGLSLERGMEMIGKGMGAANQFIAEEVIPRYPHLNFVKGIYQFYSDVFNPRDARAPDYFLNVDQALKTGKPIPYQNLVDTAKWVRENPDKGKLSAEERADLLAALAEMIEAQRASGR